MIFLKSHVFSKQKTSPKKTTWRFCARSTTGQVMLLSVLMIGSSILVFSSIAGYMMLERFRTSSNAVDSTKAIFAADSGIECELYKYNFSDPQNSRQIDCESLKFNDNKTSILTDVVGDASGTPLYVKSIGTSVKSKRAFMLYFSGAATAPP